MPSSPEHAVRQESRQLPAAQGNQGATSHMATLSSYDTDATFPPSGDHAMRVTELEWPNIVLSCPPVVGSQMINKLSLEPEAILALSGDQATLMTQRECPFSVRSRFPDKQILIPRPGSDSSAVGGPCYDFDIT